MAETRLSRGLIQVYTGDGKGKTTAALGLAMRATGAGLRVFFGQFLKTGKYSEGDALRRIGDRVVHRAFGSEKFVIGKPSERDLSLAAAGLAECAAAVKSGDFDVVILDEAAVAVNVGLFGVDALLSLIRGRPPGVEMVITGRGAHEKLVEAADLVTEMKAVKHYFEKGVQARSGIEK